MGASARSGFMAAATAFVVWGLFPLYLHALNTVPVLQVICHRVLWSCVFLLGWLLLRGELGRLVPILLRPRLAVRLLLTALLISCNWLLYVWSVANGHTVDASLGYYIGPLLNILLGVAVLHERLNPRQWLAVALATAGVMLLTLRTGHLPWIALSVALSFSLYGLVRKVISVEAIPGLATETLLLLPLAALYLLWGYRAGNDAFTAQGAGTASLLVGSGVITAVTLSLFAYGARALPYSVVGIMQYIAPTLQLLCGVLLLHEPFGPERVAGFAGVWLALAIYAGDGLWQARRARATA